jgi:hypothetical protein
VEGVEALEAEDVESARAEGVETLEAEDDREERFLLS